MPAYSPDGIRRRHEPVLENSGESALRIRASPNVHAGIGHEARVVRRRVAIIVHNRDARKIRGTKCVEGRLRCWQARELLHVSAELLRRERLRNRAIYLLADKAKDFRNAQVGL